MMKESPELQLVIGYAREGNKGHLPTRSGFLKTTGFTLSSCRHGSNQTELFRILQSHMERNGWFHSMSVPIYKSIPSEYFFLSS